MRVVLNHAKSCLSDVMALSGWVVAGRDILQWLTRPMGLMKMKARSLHVMFFLQKKIQYVEK